MRQRGCKTRFWLVPILLGVLVAGGVLVGPQTASAVDNGPTQEGQICMQRVFGTPVTNANRLNCTANDIRISRALSVSPSSCQASGDPSNPSHFTLEATFETIVTANARYDAGFFFRIDGGANARGDGSGATGICSLSALTPGVSPALDPGDGDTCGDLNAGTYSLTFTIENVACVDTDGDGFLNLPNCTSWHSNQGTACTISDPFNATNALNFHPDTKAKCVCDDTFQVPVIVESPSGAVRKTATKALVTYEVQVKNNSSTRTVKTNSLTDDVYGDITKDKNSGTPNNLIESTDCNTLIGVSISPSSVSTACHFTVQIDNSDTLGDGSSGTVTNKVTAEIEDTGNGTKVGVDGTTKITVDLGPDHTSQ
jgi:hypothetical protein